MPELSSFQYGRSRSRSRSRSCSRSRSSTPEAVQEVDASDSEAYTASEFGLRGAEFSDCDDGLLAAGAGDEWDSESEDAQTLAEMTRGVNDWRRRRLLLDDADFAACFDNPEEAYAYGRAVAEAWKRVMHMVNPQLALDFAHNKTTSLNARRLQQADAGRHIKAYFERTRRFQRNPDGTGRKRRARPVKRLRNDEVEGFVA